MISNLFTYKNRSLGTFVSKMKNRIYLYLKKILTRTKKITVLYRKSTNIFRQIEVTKLQSFRDNKKIIAEQEEINIHPIQYLGKCNMQNKALRTVPEQWSSVLPNVTVHGNSFAITKFRRIVNTDISTTLPFFSAGYSAYFKQLKWNYYAISDFTKKVFINAERGCLISHRVSSNYFHWMFECLPKILWLERDDPSCFWPIIITSELPAQINELFLESINPKRRVIKLEPHQSLHVSALKIYSTPTHMPDDLALEPFRASVSPKVINNLKSFLTQKNLLSSTQPSKILYISRAAYAKKYRAAGYVVRDIQNHNAVDALLAAYKVETFFPEEKSSAEQANAFHNASSLIMVAGSACANLIYCRPKTKIVLICKDSGVNPGLFSILIQTLDLECVWLLCTPEQSGSAHDNFSVCEKDLKRSLLWLTGEKNLDVDGYISQF